MSNGSEHAPERERIQYETDEGVVVAVNLDGTIHRMKPIDGDEADAQRAWEAYEESDAFAKDQTEVMHLPVDSVDTGPHSARAIGLSEALGDDVAGDIAYDALLLGFNAGRGSVHDNFESQRSRIAALEAVIQQAKAIVYRIESMPSTYTRMYGSGGNRGNGDRVADLLSDDATRYGGELRSLLDLAPSTVLDQMIREAKAEALAVQLPKPDKILDLARAILGEDGQSVDASRLGVPAATASETGFDLELGEDGQ